MTIHVHSDGTADDDPDCPAMTEDRVPTTFHVCEESCLHDCPECGHEVDHMAFHAPDCLHRESIIAAIAEPLIADMPVAVLATDGGPALAYAMRVEAYLRALASEQPAPALDVERLRRYEEHVGGLHCPEWHSETCEFQERCDESGCKREATNGWPSASGYRRTCSDHWGGSTPSRSEPEARDD